MTTWKGCARKQLWPNLRYYPGICLVELRNTTKLSQNTQFPSLNLNPRPPEYKEILTTRPQRLVIPEFVSPKSHLVCYNILMLQYSQDKLCEWDFESWICDTIKVFLIQHLISQFWILQ
jgi:hypothetical protein